MLSYANKSWIQIDYSVHRPCQFRCQRLRSHNLCDAWKASDLSINSRNGQDWGNHPRYSWEMCKFRVYCRASVTSLICNHVTQDDAALAVPFHRSSDWKYIKKNQSDNIHDINYFTTNTVSEKHSEELQTDQPFSIFIPLLLRARNDDAEILDTWTLTGSHTSSHCSHFNYWKPFSQRVSIAASKWPLSAEPETAGEKWCHSHHISSNTQNPSKSLNLIYRYLQYPHPHFWFTHVSTSMQYIFPDIQNPECMFTDLSET